MEENSIRKSSLFLDVMAKLGASERRVKEMESEHEKVIERWSSAKGDLELAKKTLTDMEEKHDRRWAELISQFSESDASAKANEDSLTSENGGSDIFGDAKKSVELENKLQQTMEAVSRMETLRSSLADAYKMNEQLQSKLEDLRSKNSKMVAEKAAAREKSKEADLTADTSSSPHASSKKTSASGSSSGDPTFEKLQRDYRRVRKELSAVVLSKDQAKLKQEVRRIDMAHGLKTFACTP